jgi:hypothetical protein
MCAELHELRHAVLGLVHGMRRRSFGGR